jgi:hypothetical protein
MMRHAANKPASPALGIFSPLRYTVFRRIWTASLLSNLGLLVLGVGAAWAMTKISSSTGMLALVQTSLMLPVALVSTPAGAIADMFDRRIVGLVALSIALAGSILLSTLAWLGVMTPALLLVSCFIIGSGMALFGPAWQASVSEQVPAEALPAAVALNGISYNIARSFGPAIGGVILEVLEQSDRAGPSGRETANRHYAGLQGLRDRGDYDRRYRIDASHPQGTIRTGTSGSPRSTCACSVECRAPSLKSRQYNTGRFPAPAICTRAINCPRTKMSAHASKRIRFVPKMPPLLGHAPSPSNAAIRNSTKANPAEPAHAWVKHDVAAQLRLEPVEPRESLVISHVRVGRHPRITTPPKRRSLRLRRSWPMPSRSGGCPSPIPTCPSASGLGCR